ncbi:MAG: metallophosphoesterase [Streptococcaceae bacterium]|jgi:putative phosphoesterase|nr:metallophosphoesterase [Streptococcaceae bacterium]
MTRTHKLALLSDLHLDVNHLGQDYEQLLIQTLQAEQITDVHLAGDISNDFEQVSKPFLARLSDSFTTSYNLGNHDMLGMSENQIISHDFQIRSVGRKRLLSFAGWYDYSFCPEVPFDQQLRTKNTFWFDRKINRDADDVTITNRSLATLDQLLTTYTPAEKANLIIAMHFVPEQHFLMPHPKFVKFNAFLGSEKYHTLFVKHGIQDVVFGHHHRHYDSWIDGVRYQAKPLGYQREWSLINDYLVAFPKYRSLNTYNLHKRFRQLKKTKEFEPYLLAHFPEEVRRSLIVFGL